ncbi:hypothetical protein D5R81_08510 [Parashewanella spongiae]|uniref:Porin n=1 Tax=Parashewanella spongiae TaxID=342950 RepID=A0A3A6UDT8_9GAMM|nr:TorF family putative porin [Parashewanella spongiae]MCL1078057.1 TorF family putative porin [Parashewanella spongiae]RJY16931.1 hypothetical protein D5R81_08510 [Parashewanella spongiae]
MKKTILVLGTLAALTLPSLAVAGASSTVIAVSDYSYNGYSQTEEKPALQASLDYGWDNGWYVGTFASNVDFAGGGSDLEWDAYVGKYFQLNDNLGLDTGISYYSYHGGDTSSDLNYAEVYTQLDIASSVGQSELRVAYAWDYFGFDTSHVVALAAHTVEVSEGHSLRLSFSRSMSQDETKWAWEGAKAYNNVRLAYLTSVNNFDFDISVEDTNMNVDEGDARVVLSVARTFAF